MVFTMPTNADQRPTTPFSSGENASGSNILTPTPTSYIPMPSASGSKDALKSNSHPYPIKTTSSALLSRSNSLTADTNRHLASAIRYIPPASPSPTNSRLSLSNTPNSHSRTDSNNAVEDEDASTSGSVRGSKFIGRRHRYSRSLTGSTEDLPRPLPTPPSFGFRGSTFVTPGRMSTSPTRSGDPGLPSTSGYTQLDDEDDQEGLQTIKSKDITPEGGRARAGTLPTFLPGSAPPSMPRRAYKAPSVDVNLDISTLPPNPKEWTPSQLSVYLARALRNRDGGAIERLPSRVVEDITAFVREKRMWGRTFLRLEDEDLENYGINQLWRTALLNASRSMRQSIRQGQLWGFAPSEKRKGLSCDDESQDDTPNRRMSLARRKPSPTPSNGSTSSISSTASGRVKNMVATLERSASFDEGLPMPSPISASAPAMPSPTKPSSIAFPDWSNVPRGSMFKAPVEPEQGEPKRHRRTRTGSTSSNISEVDEYGYKDTHAYTFVPKENRPLPVPPSWEERWEKQQQEKDQERESSRSPIKRKAAPASISQTVMQDMASPFERPLPNPPNPPPFAPIPIHSTGPQTPMHAVTVSASVPTSPQPIVPIQPNSPRRIRVTNNKAPNLVSVLDVPPTHTGENVSPMGTRKGRLRPKRAAPPSTGPSPPSSPPANQTRSRPGTLSHARSPPATSPSPMPRSLPQMTGPGEDEELTMEELLASVGVNKPDRLRRSQRHRLKAEGLVSGKDSARILAPSPGVAAWEMDESVIGETVKHVPADAMPPPPPPVTIANLANIASSSASISRVKGKAISSQSQSQERELGKPDEDAENWDKTAFVDNEMEVDMDMDMSMRMRGRVMSRGRNMGKMFGGGQTGRSNANGAGFASFAAATDDGAASDDAGRSSLKGSGSGKGKSKAKRVGLEDLFNAPPAPIIAVAVDEDVAKEDAQRELEPSSERGERRRVQSLRDRAHAPGRGETTGSDENSKNGRGHVKRKSQAEKFSDDLTEAMKKLAEERAADLAGRTSSSTTSASASSDQLASTTQAQVEAQLAKKEKSLSEDISETRKMIEALQKRVEEVERKVDEMETHEQELLSKEQGKGKETDLDEEVDLLDNPLDNTATWDPRALARKVLAYLSPPPSVPPSPVPEDTIVDTSDSSEQTSTTGTSVTTRSSKLRQAAAALRPYGREPNSLKGVPSYVFLVSLGVCAVVLRVVLKRALRGLAGR